MLSQADLLNKLKFISIADEIYSVDYMKSGKDCIGVGCGAIIINDRNEVLLVKRSKNSRVNPDVWSRPGGEVEFGESSAEAVEREVFEEVGIRIKAVRSLGFLDNISPDKKTHWISIGYLAEYVSGQIENKEPDKHDDIRWFPVDKLPENVTDYTKESVEEVLKGEVEK